MTIYWRKWLNIRSWYYSTRNCLYSIFAFNLENCNVGSSEVCESHAAGAYYLETSSECFNKDSNENGLVVERSEAHVFEKKNSNPVLKMIE